MLRGEGSGVRGDQGDRDDDRDDDHDDGHDDGSNDHYHDFDHNVDDGDDHVDQGQPQLDHHGSGRRTLLLRPQLSQHGRLLPRLQRLLWR